MADFVKVSALSDIPPGTGRCVEVSGQQIALFNVDGTVHAIHNECLHRGGPLAEGELEGHVVTCPWHGWQYDVRTGINTMDENEQVARYEVRIEGNDVLVSLQSLLKTALHDHLASHGAVHADDRGVELPERFTDPRREYAALTAGCAAVDLGLRTLVRATGPDRASFLQGMLTCDVAALAPGRVAYGLLLTIQGRVTADVRVLATTDALLLDVDVRARAAMLEALEKLLVADDVELGDLTVPLTAIGVEGPGAAQLLAGIGVETLSPGAHAFDASEVRGPGWVVHVPADGATRVWDALVAAGAEPCGMQALEARRVEVGVPRIGVDMDGSTLALELPVEDLISATKGCYLGQEVVARGTARGQVQRRLVGVRFDGGVPARGTSLRHAGKDVGRVTSVARARGAGEPIGLALVRREHWAPGSELEIDAGRARVTPFPIA